MRRLLQLATVVLLLLTPALAVRLTSPIISGRASRVRHKKVKKFNIKKAFPAGRDSVLLENMQADLLKIRRYIDEEDMQEAIESGELVYLEHLYVSRKLPENRRYARPATVAFIQQLSVEFMDQFGDTKHFVPLTVDSAVRPMDVQEKLRRRLGCRRERPCLAAPADGERASSHERGMTIDISRHVTKTQLRWLVGRLYYYKATNKILVIEERACFHIFVRKDTPPADTTTSVIDGTIQEESDGVQPSQP